MLPVYGPIGAIGTAAWLFIAAWRQHPIGMAALTALILVHPAAHAARWLQLVGGVACRHPLALWRRYRAAKTAE